MLLAVVSSGQGFHPRQQIILQTVAAQAALLVENERLLRSLEYRVVIQERARLAREIHDGLAQTLAFLKLQSAQMQSYLAQGDLHRLSQVLSDNYQALAEAYLDTRQSIDNLRVNPREGIDTWLDRTLADFEATTGIKVERSVLPLGQKVALEIQAQIIRVVQEALSNVRKHARAHHVWMKQHVWEETLILEIRDDGQGFDVDNIPEISHHGLRGMRERAEMIGADLQVISQPGAGTTVVLSLPLPLEEESPL
jgi:two-component system nitrate/nitrite sensor histidine kinase NarX